MKNSTILRFTHNVLVAAFIGLMITILEHHSLLNWLDSFSLRMSLAIKQEVDKVAPSFLGVKGKSSNLVNTTAVLIDNDAFEGVFNQRSPLNKSILSDLIKEISTYSPKVIAVDIDLSPARDNREEVIAQNRIDQTLIDLSGKNVGVVLVTPLPVENLELRLIKYNWMSKLCQKEVKFSYPNISLSQGVALRYSPDNLSLGVVANQFASNGKAKTSVLSPCELISQGFHRAVFLDATYEITSNQRNFDFSKMLPVLPDVIEVIDADSIKWSNDQVNPLAKLPKNEIVFLGSAYDAKDYFPTILGAKPGVVFHAAVQATDASGIKKLSTVLAFIFNFVLGVIAGYLFNWAWTRQNQSMLSKAKVDGNNWVKYLKARAWLIINLAILLSWVGVLFSLTATLLKAQLWANPIAMIIGVFIKTMTSSRKGLDGQSLLSKNPDWSKLDSVTLVGDLIFTAPVIVYGVYLTLFK